jgi:hypothetical protein
MNLINFGLLNIISFGFLFLNIAFASAMSLGGLLLNEAGFGDLGTTNLAILYLFASLCSLISTGIVNKIGVKLSLFIAGMCYFF